jgi:replicative DNA helicase Mcm
MVGDPGIAKSQLLKFISTFAPRAVLVSGQSASGAGLTGAAVHDDFNGRWAIECGALSLVSGGQGYEGGVCCVDELDKMSDKDRSAIHGALEQQSVDVAKAGVFAHMPTQCALLAAANPKYGRYDPYENIATQFNLGDALLSRMDLLYVIRDIPDQEFDHMLAHYILENKGKNNTALIDLELLRKYIAYAKTHCFPDMTQEAIDYIANFYVTTRNAGEKAKDAPPITVRALQAARRLAIANARMRLSSTVDLKDAVAACDLLLSNLHEVGVDPDTKQLDATILEAGTSGSQRSNIKKIKEIVEKLSKSDLTYQEAKLDRVLEMSLEAGIKDPAGLIKKMKTRGDLMSPTQNTLKLVK